MGLPLTGLTLGVAGLPALAIVWAGIVGVNLAYALSRRRRGGQDR